MVHILGSMTRACLPRLLTGMALLVAIPACSRNEPEPADPPPVSSPDQGAAINEAVRSYLQALADDDRAAKVMFSTGELLALADWEAMVALSFGSSVGEVRIDRLEVTDLQSTTATVDLQAELTRFGFQEDTPVSLEGPVSVVKEGNAWKVVDYVQDGLSRTESVYTEVSGGQERDGLAVEVVGVDVTANAVLVVIRAVNDSDRTLVLSPGTIVAPDGRRLGFGEPSATQRAALPSAPLETYLYWSGRSLPPNETTFDLLLDFTDAMGTVSFDFPVQLVR
jgi:hypothetical protein